VASCSIKTDYFDVELLESAVLDTSGRQTPKAQVPVVVTNSVSVKEVVKESVKEADALEQGD
jgi:hypothetical protein